MPATMRAAVVRARVRRRRPTRADLMEALDFAGEGLVKSHYSWAALEDVNAVFDRMRKNEIEGRVVLRM